VLDSIRIFDGWKFFYADFIKLVKREGDQSNASYDFTGHFADSVQGYNIYPDIESDAPERVTDTIREIIGKFYNAPPSQCQIEMEPANSLAVEMEGIPIESAPGSDEGGEDAVTGTELDRRLEEIEKQAEFVIPGKVIISPVRGKDINEVRIGDNVKILLINQDQISVKVASLLNAITEEGDFLPIKGRVKEKIPLEKSGYIFYALVAKNVLAKVVEEENVKIEMEGAEQVEKTTSSERMLILYISLLVGLFLCALLIIIAIF
jgi:tetrahydromethanopterin S-methyltransferase subunit G